MEDELERMHFQRQRKQRFGIFKTFENVQYVLKNCKRKWWGKYWI